MQIQSFIFSTFLYLNIKTLEALQRDLFNFWPKIFAKHWLSAFRLNLAFWCNKNVWNLKIWNFVELQYSPKTTQLGDFYVFCRNKSQNGCKIAFKFVCIFIVRGFFGQKSWKLTLSKLFMHMKTPFSSISLYRNLSSSEFLYQHFLLGNLLTCVRRFLSIRSLLSAPQGFLSVA